MKLGHHYVPENEAAEYLGLEVAHSGTGQCGLHGRSSAD